MLGNLLPHFLLQISQRSIARKTEFARITFALLIIHRYGDVFGASVISDRAEIVLQVSGLAIGIGAMLLVGLLTPLMLALFLILYAVVPPYAFSLSDQVAALLCWALLHLGAGRRLSVDAYVRRLGPFRQLYRVLYSFALPAGVTQFAIVRASQIFLYWGICISAMAFHFEDHTWFRLETLHLFLTMPYMTDYYEYVISFSKFLPGIFDLSARLGLFIQTYWELMLFPLMFSSIGRAFAAAQGALFVLVSAIFLNLGILPFYEIVWWGLIFGSSSFHRSKLKNNPQKVRGLISQPKWACYSVLMAFLISSIFMIERISRQSTFPGLNAEKRLWFMVGSRLFGQFPVDVFNLPDLQMGAHYVVLAEIDQNKEPTRLVDLFDRMGGRLSLLRNDLVYFDYSLDWQRRVAEIDSGSSLRLTDGLRQTLLHLTRLYQCERGHSPQSRLRAYLFSRAIAMNEKYGFPQWQEPRIVGTYDFTAPLLRKRACDYFFTLPPGHAMSTRRGKETLDYLRQLNQ